MASAVAHHQPRLDPLDDLETLLLAYAGVLLGGDGRGAGLLRKRVDGRYHTERCQIGMWVRDGDSLRGGQPCSDRCESVRETIQAGERWLKAREAAR
jgi:hypothetical protein